ncbi:PIP5K1B [Symbiodinium natans]|uniref:PIP5K1B protein n=1 Tax=Symbiodinium natans TaxID=878477 RepID=A0A812VE95_9DINO|nr:PIP5K1B [Symbiodinium natans]
MAISSRRTVASASQGEEHCAIWGIRLLSLGFLLAVRTLGKPKALPTCPTAESLDAFWSLVVLCISMYMMVDFGGCLFCACKLSWFEWLGARMGCFGRTIKATALGLAVYSLVLYGRSFTYHIQCVGVVGVFVIICAGTFILGMLAWWVLVDSDRPQSLGDGVGDEEASSVCNLFCELDPWPAPMKSRGLGSPDVTELATTAFPSSPAGITIPPSPSRLGRSSGSSDGRSMFRVLDRSGEVLYAARTRQAVRTWLKRNLDREKRKGALVEDRPRSKRRLKKHSTGKVGAVSRTPRPAAEADFALFLHEKNRKQELLDLWALDLARAEDWSDLHSSLDEDGCCRLVAGLEAAWEELAGPEYQVSPEGLGNFDDTREWLPCLGIKTDAIQFGEDYRRERDDDDRIVSKDHHNYVRGPISPISLPDEFVCSDLVAMWATQAAGGKEKCQEAFETRLPMLSYSDCTRDHVRVFPVPPGGSAYSPQTCLENPFQVEEFAPRLFSEVRRCSGISSEAYFLSVCRTDFEFIEFGTNSKSGELFFFTYDHQYLLKSTSELEATRCYTTGTTFASSYSFENRRLSQSCCACASGADVDSDAAAVLAKAAQGCLEGLVLCAVTLPATAGGRIRLKEEPRSILGRYLGLYRVSMQGHPPRLFFVMRSVTTHSLGISHTYDIKGSTRNRISDPHDSVGKDVNFDEEMGPSLDLPRAIGAEVAEVHQADVELLQEFRIMDFSLLLQIHDRTNGAFQQRRHECGVRLREIKQRQRFSFRRGLPGLPSPPSRRTRTLPGGLVPADGRTEVPGHSPEVHVRPGRPRHTWTWQGTTSLLLATDPSPSIPSTPTNWLPNDGTLTRRDASMVYTMGLIDMLVPFSAYPKMQYVGMEVITCGNGTASSRVPPDFYCERQIEKVHAMCDQETPFVD